MVMMKREWSLTAALLALVVGCGQPPAPPSGEFEVSDEAGNTVTAQAVPTNGLKGDYFDNVDFTGTTKLRYDATVNRNFGTAAPITGIQPTTYSVRWTGQVMPAFSQTYTFYVTSSDGARLMVNGQVLVNDWVDGASRMRSGTVALQANVKYDIRLEYYRNATNPGNVKLEWQSASRTRQVVPQANLFPTGMDVETALSRLTATGKVPASASLNAVNAWAMKSNDGVILNVRDSASPATYVALMTSAKVELAYRFARNVDRVSLEDLLNGRSLDLGELTQYANTNGVVETQAQFDNLMTQIAKALDASRFSVSMQSRTPGSVRPQLVTLVCEGRTPPPPACIECALYSTTYVSTLCGAAGALAAVALGGSGAAAGAAIGTLIAPGPGTAVGGFVGGLVGIVIGGPDLPTIITLPLAPKKISDAWNQYLDCIAGRIGQIPGCPVLMEGPTPAAIEITDQINSSGTRNVSYSNSSSSTGALDYQNRVFTTTSIPWDAGSGGFGLIGDVGSIDTYLTPGKTLTLQVSYQCTSKPMTIRGVLQIRHNARNVPNPIDVPLTLNCVGAKISVTPNPLEITAPVNSSVTKLLSVRNEGMIQLVVNNITSGDSRVNANVEDIVDPIAVAQSRNVRVTGTCGATPGVSSLQLQIASNDPLTPTTNLPVTLTCLSTTGFISKYIALKITSNCTITYSSGFYQATTGFRWDANPAGPGGYAGQLYDGISFGWSSSFDGVSCPSAAAEASGAQDKVLYSRVELAAPGQPGPGFWVPYNAAMDFGRNLGYTPDYVYIY